MFDFYGLYKYAYGPEVRAELHRINDEARQRIAAGESRRSVGAWVNEMRQYVSEQADVNEYRQRRDFLDTHGLTDDAYQRMPRRSGLPLPSNIVRQEWDANAALDAFEGLERGLTDTYGPSDPFATSARQIDRLSVRPETYEDLDALRQSQDLRLSRIGSEARDAKLRGVNAQDYVSDLRVDLSRERQDLVDAVMRVRALNPGAEIPAFASGMISTTQRAEGNLHHLSEWLRYGTPAPDYGLDATGDWREAERIRQTQEQEELTKRLARETEERRLVEQKRVEAEASESARISAENERRLAQQEEALTNRKALLESSAGPPPGTGQTVTPPVLEAPHAVQPEPPRPGNLHLGNIDEYMTGSGDAAPPTPKAAPQTPQASPKAIQAAETVVENVPTKTPRKFPGGRVGKGVTGAVGLTVAGVGAHRALGLGNKNEIRQQQSVRRSGDLSQ